MIDWIDEAKTTIERINEYERVKEINSTEIWMRLFEENLNKSQKTT